MLAVLCFFNTWIASAESFTNKQEDESTIHVARVATTGDQQDGSKGEAERIYEPGGDVKPPKLVHYVEPSFSRSSKEAFVEGVVRITTVVGVDGVPANLHVASGLNSEEDRTALDAVLQWRFEPGSKDGRAVRVKVTVEVDFHLL